MFDSAVKEIKYLTDKNLVVQLWLQLSSHNEEVCSILFYTTLTFLRSSYCCFYSNLVWSKFKYITENSPEKETAIRDIIQIMSSHNIWPSHHEIIYWFKICHHMIMSNKKYQTRYPMANIHLHYFGTANMTVSTIPNLQKPQKA